MHFKRQMGFDCHSVIHLPSVYKSNNNREQTVRQDSDAPVVWQNG